VIAASTIAMAHALTIEVVAEGVETEWAAAYLARTGCDYVQGYLYSPALAPQECLTWIRSFNLAGTPLSCDATTDVAGDGARAGAGRS
jgi:EAL domain-containing protein (putative c-di-GMP-specific phosphodiesterase class I)